MSETRRFAWNAIAKWFEAVVSIAMAFVTLPFLLNQLGQTAYGVTAIATTIVGISLMAQLGLRAALGRQITEQVARQDPQRVNELFSTGLACYATVSLILVATLIYFAPAIVDFARVPTELRAEGLFLVRVFATIMTVLTLLEPAFGALLFATNRFDRLSYIHSAEVIIRTVAIFGILGLTRAGLYGWAIAMLTGAGVATLATAYEAHRVWPTLEVRPRHVNRDALAKLYSLGGLLLVRENVALLSLRTDPWILSRLLGPASLAIYNPGQLVVNASTPFQQSLIRQFTPLATHRHVSGSHEQLEELLIRGTRLTFAASILVAAVSIGFAQPILQVWLGTKYHPAIAWVMSLWALRDLSRAAGGTQWPVLMGMNRGVAFTVWFQFGLAVINLLASIALTAFLAHLDWGMYATIGVVIPTVALGMIERGVMTLFTCRMVNVSVARFTREAHSRAYLQLALLLGLSLGIRWLIQPQGWLSLALCLITVTCVWAALAWFLVFDDVDRGRFRKLLRKKSGKKKPASAEVEESSARFVSEEPILEGDRE